MFSNLLGTVPRKIILFHAIEITSNMEKSIPYILLPTKMLCNESVSFSRDTELRHLEKMKGHRKPKSIKKDHFSPEPIPAQTMALPPPRCHQAPWVGGTSTSPLSDAPRVQVIQ